MAPVDWSWGEKYYAPTLAMSPTTSNLGHYANSASYFMSQPTHTSDMAAPATNISSNPPPPQSYTTASFKTSRKRSRDDAGDFDDESSPSTTEPFPSQLPTPSPPKREPIWGPGMTMIYEGKPALDACSQTGTWAEELSERLRASELIRDEGRRPGLQSRKSIRLDRSESGMDDITAAALSREARFASDPTIDEASVALGIGWSTIPQNPAMIGASRGWARHIEMHFPLQLVRIVWRNSSIPAYLVSAEACEDGTLSPRPVAFTAFSHMARSGQLQRSTSSPGYYLFDEAMTQGRLIARNWDQALANLKTLPITFEGERTMESDADEVSRNSEQNNGQHWGWDYAVSRSATPPVTAGMVENGDRMDLD